MLRLRPPNRRPGFPRPGSTPSRPKIDTIGSSLFVSQSASERVKSLIRCKPLNGPPGMIEIVLSLLCLAGGVSLALGIFNGVLPLGGLAFIGGTFLAAVGGVLLTHGIYRVVRQRYDGDDHGLRTRALMGTSALTAGFLAIAIIAVLGQLTVSGVAAGYHSVAEVLPLALFALFLAYNRRQSAIDREAVQRAQSRPELRYDA